MRKQYEVIREKVIMNFLSPQDQYFKTMPVGTVFEVDWDTRCIFVEGEETIDKVGLIELYLQEGSVKEI